MNSQDESRSKKQAAVSDFSIHQAESPAQIAQARSLFLEYAESLGFSLCFQSFDQELETLPGITLRPTGAFCLQNTKAIWRAASRCAKSTRKSPK